MILNPEFRKHLWLEISSQRLIVTLLVLLAIGIICWNVDGVVMSSLAKGTFAAPATRGTFAIFAIIGLTILGSRMAADSLVQEIQGRTWDNQRLSSQTPWALVWGKLLGSNAFIWYVCGLCLVVYVAVAEGEHLGHRRIFETTLGVILAGLTSHALVMAGTLLAMQRYRVQFQANVARLTQGATVLGVVFLIAALNVHNELYHSYRQPDPVHWLGLVLDQQDWVLFNLLVALAWSLLASYRLMRLELGMVNGINPWLGFNLFVIGYLAGFEGDQFLAKGLLRGIEEILMIGAVSSSILVYGMIFLEPKDPTLLHRMRDWLAEKNWRRIRLAMPCWPVSTFLTLIFGVLFLLLPSPSEIISHLLHYSQLPSKTIIAAGMLFMVRDLTLILLIHQTWHGRRALADSAALFYLVVLYGLIPVLLSILNGKVLMPLFLPWQEANPVVQVLAPLFEAGVMLWIFWQNMTKTNRSLGVNRLL